MSDSVCWGETVPQSRHAVAVGATVASCAGWLPMLAFRPVVGGHNEAGASLSVAVRPGQAARRGSGSVSPWRSTLAYDAAASIRSVVMKYAVRSSLLMPQYLPEPPHSADSHVTIR